jgi:AcrR family transcriptional regulator
MVEPRVLRAADQLTPRDQRILEAAASAFHERGFHGVGMDELGVRAGLSGPSLYRHFSGKDEILATLLNAAMDELMAATVSTGPDAAEGLERALRHHVHFALERAHLVSLYQREVRNLVDPWAAAFSSRMSHYTRAWERLFAARLTNYPPDRVAALAQASLGTVFSVSTWPRRARRVGDETVIADLVLTLLNQGLDAE